MSLSSVYDVKTGLKIAVKKLSRPFQSIIHAKRTYRELRLLKHMKHENVSRPQRTHTHLYCPACFYAVFSHLGLKQELHVLLHVRFCTVSPNVQKQAVLTAGYIV